MSFPYIVVTTVYPTTYGCHRGMTWSRADLILRSERFRSEETYSSRDDAIKAARKKRNANEWFTDACEPDSDNSDDDDDDDDDENSDDGYSDSVPTYQFSNTDEPPYDSTVLENWDNDEEVRFDVKTVDEYEAREAADMEYLQKARMRSRYEGTLRGKMLGMQIRDAGRVHYTFPPQPAYDIKAELEVFDYEVGEDGKNEKDGVYTLKPVNVPDNASTVKSLMYKGGKEGLGKFAKQCSQTKMEDQISTTPQELEQVGLLRVISTCDSLEELHLQTTGCMTTISPGFITKIISAAPHLRQSLKVLSIRFPFQIHPDALPFIGEFKMLERLDISDAFSADYYEDKYDYDDDSVGGQDLPYDEQLMTCINSFEHLKRLDIGNGNGESQRYLHDYMLSRYVIDELKGDLASFTMENHNVPDAWSSLERRKAARYEALREISMDENEDKHIRSMAEEEANTFEVDLQ